jgi:hypothetical protein
MLIRHSFHILASSWKGKILNVMFVDCVDVGVLQDMRPNSKCRGELICHDQQLV